METAPADDEEGGEPSRGRRLARLALRGLGWVIVVVTIVGTALAVLAELACRARLAERRKAWAVEAVASSSPLVAPRPVPLGVTTPGNAAHDYAAIEWALEPRNSWPQTPPPGMSPPALPRGFAATLDVDAIRRAGKEIERGEPLPAEAAAVVSKLAPLVRHLTDGLGRPACDWEVPFLTGSLQLPSLVALQLAAQLRLAAAGEGPDAHARAALDVVRFGQDVARIPTLIGRMFGCSVEHLGLRALEAALGRGVAPEVLRDVVRVLTRLRPAPFAAALATERLHTEVELSALDPAAFAELHRATYVGFFERYTKIALAPNPDRVRLDPNLDAEVATTWVTYVHFVLPNVRQAASRVDELEAARGALRLLAAAQLFRLERGAWPPDVAALAPFAGGPLPPDPFQGPGATLSIAVVGSELRAYSWGGDGVDDGGATAAKRELAADYTFTTR